MNRVTVASGDTVLQWELPDAEAAVYVAEFLTTHFGDFEEVVAK